MIAFVAANSDWGIGFGGSQTIILAEDRRRFKELTLGGTIVVGRRTFFDFPEGKPLPGRKNIVISRDKNLRIHGAVIVRSVAELLREISGDDPACVFAIGGGSVYRLLLPFCSRAYVTRIRLSPPSDTFFPNLDTLPDWELALPGEPQNSGGITFSFDLYVNKSPVPWKETICV